MSPHPAAGLQGRRPVLGRLPASRLLFSRRLHQRIRIREV